MDGYLTGLAAVVLWHILQRKPQHPTPSTFSRIRKTERNHESQR
jgi:hypothetical protein